MTTHRGVNWRKVMVDLHVHYTDGALSDELKKMGATLARTSVCELRKGRPPEPKWSVGDALLELQARIAP